MFHFPRRNERIVRAAKIYWQQTNASGPPLAFIVFGWSELGEFASFLASAALRSADTLLKSSQHKNMQRITWWMTWCLLPLCGCAAGPFEELAWMNPVHRQEWAKDNNDANNYHNRIVEYRKIASSIAQLSPEIQDDLAQDLSLEFEHEADPLYRVEIVRALGPAKSPAAEGGLRKAAKDPNPNVRIASCVAWRKRGGDSASKVLSELLVGDTDRNVRIYAAKELGYLKDRSTMRSLGIALEQDDPAMQFACVESLKSISGRDYGNNLSAWRELADGGDPPQEPKSIAKGLQSLLNY